MSLNDIILRSAWFIFSPLVRGLFTAVRLASLLPRPSLEPLKALAPSFLTGYGSLAIFKRLPPEILEEIFVQTCGAEYIAFFNHFSLPHKDFGLHISGINTVYLLKAVCKEWRELAEQTPRLWQRVYFDFDDFWVDMARFRSVQHFEGMVEHVLLRRSAGLGLHLKISGQAHERDSLDMRSRMRHFVPLLHILAKESHRWSSVVFWNLDSRAAEGGNTVVYATLQSIITHSSFPRLRSLIFDTRATRHSNYSSPRLDFSSSAPAIKEFMIRAGDFEVLSTSSPIIKCRWSSLTTLVIDCQGIAQPTSTLLHASAAFEAARNTLVNLHWRGCSSAFPGPCLPLTRVVEFECLRSLVVEDTAFIVCDVLLPSILCPTLQTLQILLCKAYASASTWQWEQSIPQSVSNLKKFLHMAPFLGTFSIVYSPGLEIYVLHQEKDYSNNSKRLAYGHMFLHGSPNDVRRRIQPLTEWNDPSAEDSFPSLPRIRSNLLGRDLPAKTFSFVPFTAYSSKPKKGRGVEPARLLPAMSMTLWEQRVRSERAYGEKERVERLLAFVRQMSQTPSLYDAGRPEKVSCALREVDHVGTLVLVHLLQLLGSSTFPDILPNSCRVTLSVAI
jgi:hypothetical protein